MSQKPTKEELFGRILPHVKHHNNSDAIVLLWKGYLAALMEWGFLTADDYHELDDRLGEIEEELRREIFLGYPGQYE
jgi:hypothetical protein